MYYRWSVDKRYVPALLMRYSERIRRFESCPARMFFKNKRIELKKINEDINEYLSTNSIESYKDFFDRASKFLKRNQSFSSIKRWSLSAPLHRDHMKIALESLVDVIRDAIKDKDK